MRVADVESRGAGTGDEGVMDKQPQAQTSQHVAAELFLSGGRWKAISHNRP